MLDGAELSSTDGRIEGASDSDGDSVVTAGVGPTLGMDNSEGDDDIRADGMPLSIADGAKDGGIEGVYDGTLVT